MIQSRPTNYAGVTMRSRLEAGFAQWLDEMGFSWDYEPECFAGPGGQWLPDFRVYVPCIHHDSEITLRYRFPVYVEVKPSTFGPLLGRSEESIDETDQLARRMRSTYECDAAAAAVLVQEGTIPTLIEPGDVPARGEPLDWTWTGLWPIDARRVGGPWQGEWWKGAA